MARKSLPYGTWPSPISAEMAAGKSRRFGTMMADGDALTWSEGRPDEGGRMAIMRAFPGGTPQEMLRAPWSARSRVHEYGGGEFLAHDGMIWFVEADGQQLHVIAPGGTPRAITDAPDLRFADMAPDTERGRLICVAERHEPGGDHGYPENFLAGVPLWGDGEQPVALVTGRDFYASPRISPDGGSLAWLAWDLPHMPWEAAALYAAAIDSEGVVGAPERIAGGDGSAVFQPEWTGDGKLCFVWDKYGWGNLYAWEQGSIRAIAPEAADLMRPQWAFGMRSYAALADGRVAGVRFEGGEARPGVCETDGGGWQRIGAGLRSIDSIVAFGNDVAVFGNTDRAAPAVLRLRLEGGGAEPLRAGAECGLGVDDISVAGPLEIPAGGDAVHALYYPPANASCRGPKGDLPPAIVTVHGGPTGRADRGFKIRTQFWTSRGFAVCDVDYSGSAGYGRSYQERLDGQWGLRDVADVVAAARHLAAVGLADPRRLIVSGGSAGGLTVLLALARHDIFTAGACAYAVCDLAQLQRITHKFEAGYLYGLTGTTPQNCDRVFAERSPINLADGIAVPVIFFQGEDDKVVPPRQTRAMADILRRKGVRVVCHEFPGEGHGFRRGETIARVLELEYAFYAEVLGLDGPGSPRAASSQPKAENNNQ